MPACALCGHEVNPSSAMTWRRVHGWERKAMGVSRKSGSDIVLREPGDELAHDDCIRRAKRGLAPTQESLM